MRPSSQSLDLPASVARVSLGDRECFTRYGGGTPRRSVDAYWKGGTIPWVTNGEVEEGSLCSVADSKERITELAVREGGVTLVPPGSVLVACTASIGKVAIASVELTFNQQFNAFVCNEARCLPRYLGYCFLGRKEELEALAGETTFKHIVLPRLMRFEIPLPPLEDQERIVSKLDRIDRAIRLQHQSMQKMQLLMQSALHRAFIGEL